MAAESQIKFARGDVISRKYEIEEELGEGIFGTTYLTRHISSGRMVVVKFLRPELMSAPGAIDRLKSGFARVKAVRHAGIVQYGEINEHAGLHYVTAQHQDAETLRAVIDRHVASGEPFTLQDACQIVIKVLEALGEAHAAGIVHRDLKPESILVHTQRSGPGGSRYVRTVWISDLGLPDMVNTSALGDRFDSAWDTSYMAPELISLGQETSARADIFSVGVILYELLCGQPPKGTFFSPTQVRDDLPEHVDHLVELALSPEPTDRYPSARDMVLDIQRSFNLEMQSGKPATSARSVMFALGAALLATIAVGVYVAGSDAADPLEDARKQDTILRREVQNRNPLPNEAELKLMQQANRDMVFVPSGTFVQGRLNAEDPAAASPAEPLAREIQVDAFFIDRFEFPNRPDELPAGNVSYAEAEKACTTQGKRLCTALEWEKACKGLPNYVYAYGDTYDPTMCGASMDEEYKTGQRRDCVSTYGAYDLSGGFREWTASSPPNKATRRVVKGGSRGSAERGTRCAFSVDEDINYSEPTMTFRCCKGVE